MTEAEWLACNDPERMLGVLLPGLEGVRRRHGDAGPVGDISDRKLRLWACAAWRLVFLADGIGIEETVESAESAERHADDPGAAMIDRHEWILAHSASDAAGDAIDVADDRELPILASILRSIVGNPFRSVTLKATCPECDGRGGDYHYPHDDPTNRRLEGSHWHDCHACDGEGAVGDFDPAWLTPQAALLAGAAYQDRQPDGSLDPVTLAALADALLEAGCPAEAEGTEVVEYCNAFMYGCEEFDAMDTCTHKVKRERRVLTPHPVIAQLRGPGPLYRGSFAVDLVLGKG